MAPIILALPARDLCHGRRLLSCGLGRPSRARAAPPGKEGPLDRRSSAGWLQDLDRHAWILSLVLCLPALVPTLLPGWFEGHDDLHIYRLIEYDLALRDGQIPPRWFPDISAGHGNPHPIYYAPLFYFAAELFHLAGIPVILSLKLAIIIFMLVAALAMYRFARCFWSPAAAIVASAAYTYAPYHLLDLYVRKALSEFTVFAFLPLLLLAFYYLRTRGSRWDIIGGALTLAAMSTAHTITTMMVPALAGAYALFLTYRAGTPRERGSWTWVGRASVSVILGYAIAGFFLLPAFLERNEINLKIYTKAYVAYQKHFVYPIQLIWWPWDFGMSLDGLADKMSFRLGLFQMAGTLLAMTALKKLRRSSREAADQSLFFLGVTALAVFMMVPASTGIWDALPPLKFVQFPWRFLTLTTLSMPFLCAAAFKAYGPPEATGSSKLARRRHWLAALAIVAAFPAAAAVGGMLGVNLRVPADRVGFEEKPYNQMIDRGEQAADDPETMDGQFVRRHTLHWLDHLPPGVSFMGLTGDDLRLPPAQIEAGRASLDGIVVRTDRLSFRVIAGTVSTVRVNTYRFPGWTVRVNGTPVEMLEPPARRRIILFNVPPGENQVEVVFRNTPPRIAGNWLTLAGLAGLALVGLWPDRRRR